MGYPAATHYVDPAGNNADGLSWATAWTSMQSAVTNCVAGNVCYMRGTQTLALNDEIDFTGTSGTVAAPIMFLGCSAAGTAGAGEFTLDCNSAAANGIALNTTATNYIWLEHVKIINATNDGFAVNVTSLYWVLKHVAISGCGGNGFELYQMSNCNFINCVARDNTSRGFYYSYSSNKYAFCMAEGNGGEGFYNYTIGSYVNCVAIDNTGDGFGLLSANNLVVNCTSDGSTGGSGIKFVNAGTYMAICNRLTNNNQYGIEYASANMRQYDGYNGFRGNGVAEYLNPLASAKTENKSESLTADGYTNAAADDYNLTDAAEMRNEANNLDWDLP